jgi:PAS domain S-box-containing protein
VNLRLPISLRLTIPLVVLGFAAMLSAVNVLYHVPRAEHAAVDDIHKRVTQEMSRLQSTLEYLLLKGDLEAAQQQIAVLAHNHDYDVVVLTNEQRVVIAATRRAWLDREITGVFPKFDSALMSAAIRERGANLTVDKVDDRLIAYSGILMGREQGELRPSRSGGLFLAYDLKRSKSDARTQVMQQSLYWAGWVTALALAMWLAFHFLLTRRTAQLVRTAEAFAAGKIEVRSELGGDDELGRLSRAFDAMASEVADTQNRLRADIVERQHTEEALRVSEASYRAIFDAVEEAIFVLDVDKARIVDLNPKASTAYGYTREEMRQTDLRTLSSGAPLYTREDAEALVARVIAGEQLRFEWHVRHKDGSLHWDEVSVKRVMIGGRDRILGMASDITDRKMAEAALRASEEQYRSMFNASIDGLALWDAAGEVVDTNPAMWRMYGYADEELTALPAHHQARPVYDMEFLRKVASGVCVHMEVTELRRDGAALEIEVHGIPMQYQGKPHVLTIARDITEKKRSALELAGQREAVYQREKLAALGALLAGVAHELNNPLTVVVARAVILEELGEPSTRNAAMRIRVAADRCARIVRTFLAMVRQQTPEHSPTAINEVISAALDIAAYALRTSSVEVALDLATDIPLILADADQLHQVMLNLIINAQQALLEQTPPRRLRLISQFNAVARRVHVTLGDNGPGIPPLLRARIFEPYFTTKPTGIGTGVGLAVSLGIIKAHGGKLTVDCPAEGGTIFNIVLPAVVVDSVSDVIKKPVLEDNEVLTVLVVDDEVEIRETLSEILGGVGHRVVTASSGREALERLSEAHYEVILTDLRMPDLDGSELYREIKLRWPERAAQVVFLTGDILSATSRNVMAESHCAVIEKPFQPSEVRRVVAQIATLSAKRTTSAKPS